MYGPSPYGSAPYGASSSAGGAISSPISTLLSGDLHIALEHLLWTRPFNPITGVRKNLYISSGASRNGWYRTAAGDTFPTGEACEHELFIAHLLSPPNIETRILSNGEVYYGTSSYGQCIVIDQRRDLISWLSFNWTNADFRYLIGDPLWNLSSFAEVFHGVSTALSPELTQMSIGVQDVVAKLQSADYQTKRYDGRGPCIRLNGSTGYLAPSGSIPSPVGSMTIGVRVRARAVINTDESIAGWRISGGAGNRRLRTDVGNAVAFNVTNDAAVTYYCTAPGVLSSYTWVTLWGVLDVAAGRISLYNGLTPGTPIAQAVISGTFTTSLTNFTVGRLSDASSNFLTADVDEITIWDHALTAAEITQWTDQRAPSGTTGLVYQYSMIEGTGATVYEAADIGATGVHSLALTGGASWVDSLTGGDEIKGKCIPKGCGIRRKVAPVALSSTSVDLIYQVAEAFDHIATDASGPILEDGGIRVWVLKGVYADPWAATPAPGEYMEIPTMGLIRLGSAPIRQLTCDVYITAAVDMQSCIQSVVLGDGGLPSAEFDAASCAALPATSGVGCYSGLDSIKIDAVLTNQLLPNVKAWRAVNGNGALTFGLVRPPETQTPIAYLTGDDFTIDGVRQVNTLPAARGAVVRYRPYQQTQQPTNANPTLTEAEKQDLNQPYRSSPPTPDNLTVLGADPSADLAVRQTTLDSLDDANAQAVIEALWRAVPRRTDSLTQVAQVPRFQVGQIINITMAALDYDNGKNVMVGAVILDGSTGTYSIEVIGALVAVGLDTMLVGDGTGAALVGDGTGEGVVS